MILSCSVTNAQMVTIHGVNKNDLTKSNTVCLMSLENGALKNITTTVCGKNGAFGFLVDIPYEGFYAIGSEEMKKGHNPIYLKPGDVAEVTLVGKHMIFSDNNTPENVVLGKWVDLTKNIKRKSLYFMDSVSNYVDFFPDLYKVTQSIPSFLEGIKTPNKLFNKAMSDLVGYDSELFATNFLFTPRIKYPSKDSLPDFYSKIVRENRFPDDAVFETIYGLRTLSMYVKFASRNDANSGDADKLKYLTTDRQKAEYLSQNAFPGIKTYDDYLKFVDDYGKYFTEPYLKQRLEAKGAEIYSMKAGDMAADFTYPDVNGKMVSLSDFKGKVVFVDVWATWCSPCKKEIPFVKKLEEEYHGKDVVFMSVSIDVDKDKQAWLNMIKEKEMGGVQLFAGGLSKIGKYYKIQTIPRFMVFDKKGNIVSVDAPRPSDPKLKEMLNSELVK